MKEALEGTEEASQEVAGTEDSEDKDDPAEDLPEAEEDSRIEILSMLTTGSPSRKKILRAVRK